MRSTTTMQERRAKKKAQQELEWRNEITNYVPFSNKSINSNPSSNNNSPPKQPIIHSENTTAVSSPSLSNAPSSPLPNGESITTESDTHSAIAIDTASSPVKTSAANTDVPSTTAPPSDFQFSAAPILSPREQEESSKIDAWRTRRRSASQDHEKLRREKEEVELKLLEEEDAKVTELVEEVETLAQQITHQVITNKSRPKRLSTTTLRKSPLKREFNKIVRFNMMTVGEPGCGKSTFIKSLMDKLDRDTDCKLYQSLAKELHLEKDAINSLHQSSSSATGGEQQGLRQLGKMEWLSDKGNMISFSVAESNRYGDSTNNTSIISTIKETIQIAHNKRNAQQPQLMSEQEVLDADDRIHVLFYFISPHRMKEIDIEFITQLAPLVPIIPIIAKADAMTMNERNSFLQIVKNKLNTISQPMKESCIYDFYDGMMSSPTSPTKDSSSSSSSTASSAAILSPTAFLSPLSPLPLKTSYVLLQLESSENEVDAVDTDLEVDDDDDETDTIPSPVLKNNNNSAAGAGSNMRKRPSVDTPSPTHTVPSSLPPQLPLVNESNIFPTICGTRDYPWGTAALNTSCSSKVVMNGNNVSRMSISGVSELERLQDNLISSEFQLRDLLTATQTKSIALYKSVIKAALLQPLHSSSSSPPLSPSRDQVANAGSRIKNNNNNNNNGSRIANTDNTGVLRGSKTAESSPEKQQGGGTNIRRSQSSRELHSAASAGSPAMLKTTASTRWGTSSKTADTAASSAGGDSKSTENTPRNLSHFRTTLFSTFFNKKTNKE